MERQRRLAFHCTLFRDTGGDRMGPIESFIGAATGRDRKLGTLAAREFQTTVVRIMGHRLPKSPQGNQGTFLVLRAGLEQNPQQAWLDRGERAVTKLTEQ